jgi:hypothetical protein
MKKIAALTALALLTATGAASASLLRTITLHGGQKTKIAGTTVRCIALTKTVTVAPIPNTPITFNGNGSVNLFPFTLKTSGNLSWTWVASEVGGSLFVNDNTHNISVVVDSQATTGKSFLPAGTYQLSVIAQGDWTITVS